MSDFMCPSCGEKCSIELEDMPDRARDEKEFECENCGQEMKVTKWFTAKLRHGIGWYAEVEARGITIPVGDY